MEANSSSVQKNLFKQNEMKILHSFFHDKLVIKADLKDSLKALSDLFKDLQLPPLLERRIIESFLYASETVSDRKLILWLSCLELL